MRFAPRATFALTAALSPTFVRGQSPNFTYVDCTDQTEIRKTGFWNDQALPRGTNVSLETSRIYNGTWELASNLGANVTKPASLEFSFLGNTVVIVGIVVNGVEGQSLNFSVQIDDQGPSTPIYKPSAAASNNLDYAYQLFAQAGLINNRHTIKAMLTGETSNFLFDVIAYTTIPPGSLLESSAPTNPSTAIRTSATVPATQPPTSSGTDPASLGGAIGGGVAALLLVIFFIWYTMRRISRREAQEVIEAPRPWVMVSSTPTRSTPAPASSTVSVSHRAPSSTTEGFRKDRKVPIIVDPPVAPVPVNRPRSPTGSMISVPTEFYPLSPTYQPTAVASSHIGTIPLPDVPTSPRDTTRDSRTTLTPTTAALGLHSSPSSRRSRRDVNRSDASLSRPLPLRPGTNQVGGFTYPPEKRGR